MGGDFLLSFQGAKPEAAEGEAGREEMEKLIWGAGARKWPRAERISMAREEADSRTFRCHSSV